MNYQKAEQYILSFANLPKKEYKNPRDARRRALLRSVFFLSVLGRPEARIPHCVHIAGTSGKGSVATLLESMLRAAGIKTGLMTSPHPTTLRERWQVEGRTMSKRELTRIVSSMRSAVDAYARVSPYDPLSFFDLVTAIGFAYFAEKKVAWAIIEAGMGGRYDATNAMKKKDIAIITNIGHDHLDTIGPRLADVAREKAGIILRHSTVITAETRPALRMIIQQEADRQRARLETVSKGRDHQGANRALAEAAARHIGIPERAIASGMARVKQPLRFEIVSKKPLIILDGAHNTDKMKTTVAAMREIKTSKHQRIHLIVGFSADKNIGALVKQLASLSPAGIACTRNTVNPFRKVADPVVVAKLFKRRLPRTAIGIFLDPTDAVAAARKRMKKNDILLVTGSIFLSGELRIWLT